MDKLFKNKVWLAPMAGITDKAFRIITRPFNPGIMFTEMVSSKGLLYENQKTKDYLDISEEEGMVGIQIFGHSPEEMKKITYEKLNNKTKVININMGCPAPKIVKNKDGCYLMKEPKLASQIVKAVASVSSALVSVKIRKGWDKNAVNAIEFAKILQESGASFVIIHGKTKEQFYSGEVDLEIIRKVKESVKIPIVGNGDIVDEETAEDFFKKTNCDAIMIGRAARGNPWIFQEINHFLLHKEKLKKPSLSEKIATLLKHAKILINQKEEKMAIREFRKHLFWYLKSIKLSALTKEKINASKTYSEIEDILGNICKNENVV